MHNTIYFGQMFSPGGAKHATSHSTEASVHTRDRPPCTTDNRAPFPVHTHTHTSDFLEVGSLGRMYCTVLVVQKHARSHSTEGSVQTRDRSPCTTDNRAPFPVHTHTYTSDFLGVGPLGRFRIIRHRSSLRLEEREAHPLLTFSLHNTVDAD